MPSTIFHVLSIGFINAFYNEKLLSQSRFEAFVGRRKILVSKKRRMFLFLILFRVKHWTYIIIIKYKDTHLYLVDDFNLIKCNDCWEKFYKFASSVLDMNWLMPTHGLVIPNAVCIIVNHQKMILRNKNYHMLINKYVKNCIIKVTTYPSLDISFYHNQLVHDFRAWLKNAKVKSKWKEPTKTKI